MRQVQLHEEEEQFATLVAAAEAGESLTILRDGKPVARIVPVAEARDPEADRIAAAARLDALMEKGYDMGVVWNGGDELYQCETALLVLERLPDQNLQAEGAPAGRDEVRDGR